LRPEHIDQAWNSLFEFLHVQTEPLPDKSGFVALSTDALRALLESVVGQPTADELMTRFEEAEGGDDRWSPAFQGYVFGFVVALRARQLADEETA
jgi:hypothetical protein